MTIDPPISAAAPVEAAKPDKILYGIQVLRAVAAILVVMRHAAKAVTMHDIEAFAHGQFGVDIFFVISGLVIYLTGRKLSAGRFLARRLARVAPLYWLALLVTIAGDYARHKVNAFTATNAIASFFFLPSHNTATQIFPPNVVGWSLNYEMYFYLVCTLAIVVAGGGRMIWVASAMISAGIVTGIALNDVIDWQAYPISVLLLPISFEFLAGMWLARLFVAGRSSPSWLAWLLFAGAVIWIVLAPTATPYTRWRPLSWGIPAAAIIWATLSLEPKLAAFRWRPALELGDASYALYLVHPIVLGIGMPIAVKLDLHRHMAGLFLVLVTLSLVAGVLVHRLIERPLLRVSSRVLGLRRVSARGTMSADAAAL